MSTTGGGIVQRLGRLGTLLANPRAPKLPKLAVLVAVAYALWPVDLIPEAVFGVFGLLDDAVVLWLSLGWLFRSATTAPAPSGTEIVPGPSPGSSPHDVE